MIEPLYLGGNVESVKRGAGEEMVKEISEAGLMRILEEGRALQAEICGLPLEERLQVIDWLGEVWKERLMAGELATIKERLGDATGYPTKLIDIELSLVPRILNGEEIERNLGASLIGGGKGLEGFIRLNESEGLRHLPVGPSLIISSGNSIIPTLIPTTISMVTGNFTLLKPSLSNFEAVVEVFSGLRELMSRSPAAHLMARALCISYLGHDSPGLKTALASAPFGAINFWGGEPARSTVAALVAQNPAHPRFFANGPLTGVAIVGQGQDGEAVAKGLALNMVLYEQQLCSSPTIGVYVGDYERALRFASQVRSHLESIGAGFEVDPSNDALFVTNSARKVMVLKGSKVLQSASVENPWTLAVSKGRSNMEAVVASFPSFNVHGRRRFLEMVVVEDVEKAAGIVRSVPAMTAFKGVDKVQTVGLSLPEEQRKEALWALSSTGIYRIVPIEDMFMRSSAEPYDGIALASLFTYAVYERRSPIPLEGAV